MLSKVFRNETLESIHRGSIVVMDGSGKMIASAGDPDRLTFWRSAAKLFQTLPCVTSGAADSFGFEENELALACASHSGEKGHTDLAEQMLSKAGFSESDLLCGAHSPFDEESNREKTRLNYTTIAQENTRQCSPSRNTSEPTLRHT